MTVLMPLNLSQAFASAINECGRYQLYGQLEREDSLPVLVVFAGSISETRLTIHPKIGKAKIKDFDALAAFQGLPAYFAKRVEVHGEIRKQITGRRGTIEMQSMRPVLPAKLGHIDADEYRLKERLSCEP